MEKNTVTTKNPNNKLGRYLVVSFRQLSSYCEPRIQSWEQEENNRHAEQQNCQNSNSLQYHGAVVALPSSLVNPRVLALGQDDQVSDTPRLIR